MERFVFCTLALLVLGLVGCGESGPATIPVTGTVTWNGNPVEGATVTFLAEGASTVAGGVTDVQGKFSLKMGEKEGAIAGEHAVSVSKKQGGGQETIEDAKAATMEMANRPPMMTDEMMAKDLLPAKYGSPTTSGLTATVEAGGNNDFTFELTGDAP